MQLQAANISIVITGGCDAHFGPLCNGGRYWSLSALRRGLLMKPSENPLCSVRSVCVGGGGAQVMFDSKCRYPYTSHIYPLHFAVSGGSFSNYNIYLPYIFLFYYLISLFFRNVHSVKVQWFCDLFFFKNVLVLQTCWAKRKCLTLKSCTTHICWSDICYQNTPLCFFLQPECRTSWFVATDCVTLSSNTIPSQ